MPGFLGRVVRAADHPDDTGAGRIFARSEPSAARHDAAVEAAAAVTPVEQSWLTAHIDADGARDAYEQALLAFLAEERRPRG